MLHAMAYEWLIDLNMLKLMKLQSTHKHIAFIEGKIDAGNAYWIVSPDSR